MGDRLRDKPNLTSIGPGGNLDLDNIFSYHAPTEQQVIAYQNIRNTAKELAVMVNQMCPVSPDRSTALIKIREAVMWANASIACNQKESEDARPE